MSFKLVIIIIAVDLDAGHVSQMYVSVVRQSTFEVCTALPAAEELADSSVTGR